MWETSSQIQLFLSKMREHPSSARQYKLPPQALRLWHPTLLYHHQAPQHKPASLSRAATSSASPCAHSLRSWLPTSPPPRAAPGGERHSAKPGKSWHRPCPPLAAALHKGARAGAQPRGPEPVTQARVPAHAEGWRAAVASTEP